MCRQGNKPEDLPFPDELKQLAGMALSKTLAKVLVSGEPAHVD
jgi:hypothetical protein